MILTALAHAGPVVCDPDEALRLLEETGVPADRVPAIAPELLPGIARARTTGTIRATLDAVCADPPRVAITAADRWDDGRQSATVFTVTTARQEDCALVQSTVRLSAGSTPTTPLAIAVLEPPPDTITPIGDCATRPQYREDTVIAGADGPVRVVLQVDHGREGASRVLVRSVADATWHEQLLLSPAPARLTGGVAGPIVTLVDGTEPWIVAHHDRTARCIPRSGQTVWRREGVGWRPATGRDALGRLADRGLWRLASDDGWFHVVASVDPSDRALLEARVRKRQPLTDETLHIRESGRFPLLNAGFLFVAPDPWPTRDEAATAQQVWPRKTESTVRRGWRATADPCVLTDAPGTTP